MSYSTRFKYEENEKLPWGMLTVLFPVLDDDGFSTSKYMLQCACGSDPFEMRAGNITRGIKTQANWVYSCGCSPQPRKPPSRIRPKTARYVPNYTDQYFGRLCVVAQDPAGLDCLCADCLKTIRLADPKKMAMESLKPCRNPCS